MKARFLPAIIFVAANCAFPQAGVRPVIAPLHAPQPHRAFRNTFPWLLGDYDYDAYAPTPSVVIVQQPPLYVMVPTAPSEPPKAEMHEYSHPATTADEEQAFAIVLKDAGEWLVLCGTGWVTSVGEAGCIGSGSHRAIEPGAQTAASTSASQLEKITG